MNTLGKKLSELKVLYCFANFAVVFCVCTVVQMIYGRALEHNHYLKAFLKSLKQGAMKIKSTINWLIKLQRITQ